VGKLGNTPTTTFGYGGDYRFVEGWESKGLLDPERPRFVSVVDRSVKGRKCLDIVQKGGDF